MEVYKERIDKIIASSGLLSRKDVKRAAQSKRITLNGCIIKDCSTKATVADILCLDGKPITYSKYIYIMMNKPKGYVCSTDDPKSPTVLDLLPEEYIKAQLFSIGRLDKNTTGLIILTNDGKLCHDLLSPSKHVNKTYRVSLKEPPKAEYKDAFSRGIKLDDGYVCKKADITFCEENNCIVTISEGKFHQIKRMFESLGNKVIDLERISIGDVILDIALKQAEFRHLTMHEISSLKSEKSPQ